MKKFLALSLPLLIVFSLSGCFTTEYTYIKPTLREVWKVDNPQGTEKLVGYQTQIGGKWYDADENGQLTDKGKKQKQMAEANDSGGGGGASGGGGGY